MKIAGSTKVYRCWCALKWTYGLVAIVAGLDKFFNLITFWEQFINPFFLQLFNGTTPTQLIYLVGVIEIAAGLLIFFRTRIGAYLVMAWLLFIAAQLIGLNAYPEHTLFNDVVVRDVVMALGAYVLAQLTEVKMGSKN